MGRAPCCDKANVKKGPWSPEEDAKLKEFIEKFGTGGNWIALPQKAGLKRCGKSCRLRWLNYLRPNIKHGEFSDEEDRIICALYANIGSRWSIIAAQLPGRTDNDIKNYWNTKLKKKLMGMIPSNPAKYSQLQQFSNTFQSQSHSNSHSLSTLSQLYRDYNSLYFQAASKSLSTVDQSNNISAPQNFLYCNNNDNFSLSTNYQYPYFQQNQDGLSMMDTLQYSYNPGKESSNMLIFGGNEASCSSSDGSNCGKEYYHHHHVKQEEIGCSNFQGIIQNGVEENQKFMLHYGKIHENNITPAMMSGFVDEKGNGILESSQLQCDLEEVKQLISSGNCSNNNNSCSLLFNDGNKAADEREMYFYY